MTKMEDDSLFKTCVTKTSDMILKNYWRTDIPINPFLNYHPNVIQELIERICQQVKGRLKSPYIHLLVASGRVEHFKLTNVELCMNDVEDIFRDLQSSVNRIKSIKMENVFLESSDESSSLGRLIRLSKSLKSVETCVSFALSEIYFSDSLQVLTLNCVIRDRFKSFHELRRKTRYNRSLRILKIRQPQGNPRFYREIATIMQYCLELVEIDYDVAETLEYLYENSKLRKYKLQKTVLGSDITYIAKRATEKAITIASFLCPELQDVKVIPEDYRSIHALSNFRHITVLTLNQPRWHENCYHEGIRPLLEVSRFGTNLKSLTLKHFSQVDFASIGACCPNIEQLTVEYFSENNASDLPPIAFQKLVHLNLVNMYIEPCHVSTFLATLANASALEFLKVRNASALTDDVLDSILKNNDVFSKLKVLNLGDCGFTVMGLKKLARRLTVVKHVLLSSRIICEDDARSTIKSMSSIFFVWNNLEQN